MTRLQLNIGIVGGGIAGLSMAIALSRQGHRVTVYEAATELTAIGAGIQLAPNASKILLNWGVGEYLPDLVKDSACFKVRRWENGSLVGRMSTETYPELFGGSYVQVHRADLQQALFKVAQNHGVVVKTKSRVVDYDSDLPALVLEDGETIQKDFIVAADGVKSIARKKIDVSVDQYTEPTGLSVFRAPLKASAIEKIPELAHLVQEPGINLWVGPSTHAIAYALRGDSIISLVLEYVDSEAQSESDESSHVTEIQNLLEGWDPNLIKMWSMIESPLKWSLNTSVPLNKWYPTSGKILLAGDASHTVPPFLAQGAALAIEDAVILTRLISQTHSKSDLVHVCREFQELRLPRKLKVVECAWHNLRLYHLADGEQQKQRDDPRNRGADSAIWDNEVDQKWLYGFDADASPVSLRKSYRLGGA